MRSQARLLTMSATPWRGGLIVTRPWSEVFSGRLVAVVARVLLGVLSVGDALIGGVEPPHRQFEIKSFDPER
jgi:hypothetical protein